MGAELKAFLVFAILVCGLGLISLAKAEGDVFDPAATPSKVMVCTMPVTREDGTALALSEIDKIEFYQSSDKANWVQAGTATVCKFTLDMTKLANGQYYYHARAVDTGGRASKASNVIPFVVKRVLPPNPPATLRWE